MKAQASVWSISLFLILFLGPTQVYSSTGFSVSPSFIPISLLRSNDPDVIARAEQDLEAAGMSAYPLLVFALDAELRLPQSSQSVDFIYRVKRLMGRIYSTQVVSALPALRIIVGKVNDSFRGFDRVEDPKLALGQDLLTAIQTQVSLAGTGLADREQFLSDVKTFIELIPNVDGSASFTVSDVLTNVADDPFLRVTSPGFQATFTSVGSGLECIVALNLRSPVAMFPHDLAIAPAAETESWARELGVSLFTNANFPDRRFHDVAFTRPVRVGDLLSYPQTHVRKLKLDIPTGTIRVEEVELENVVGLHRIRRASISQDLSVALTAQTGLPAALIQQALAELLPAPSVEIVPGPTSVPVPLPASDLRPSPTVAPAPSLGPSPTPAPTPLWTGPLPFFRF